MQNSIRGTKAAVRPKSEKTPEPPSIVAMPQLSPAAGRKRNRVARPITPPPVAPSYPHDAGIAEIRETARQLEDARFRAAKGAKRVRAKAGLERDAWWSRLVVLMHEHLGADTLIVGGRLYHGGSSPISDGDDAPADAYTSRSVPACGLVDLDREPEPVPVVDSLPSEIAYAVQRMGTREAIDRLTQMGKYSWVHDAILRAGQDALSSGVARVVPTATKSA